MKQIKTIFATVVTLILLLATIMTINAEGTPTIEVGSATAKPGDTVEIPVTFKSNPGISAYTLAFTYDPEVLTLEDVKSADDIGGNFTFKERAVWVSSGNVDTGGVFLTLHFKVAPYVEEKDYQISVLYNKGDICNYNEEDVDFEVKPGFITVKKESSSEDSDTTKETSGIVSDFSQKILEKHTASEVKDAVNRSLDKIGAEKISDLSDEQKSDFIKNVATAFGYTDEEFDGITTSVNETEIINGFSEIISEFPEKAETSNESADSAQQKSEDKDSSKNIILPIIAVAVVLLAVITVIIVKKNKNKTQK